LTGLLQLAHLPATGRGVRIAVIDSGVHAAHPHVHGVAGGVGIDSRGHERADYTDRLGHGTAVTAAICEKAPDAEIFAIKVFERELATTGQALVAALRWAVERRADIINLSLGTTNPDHEPFLADTVQRARDGHVAIVAAAPQPDARWLPGALPGVVRVEVDWTLPRDTCRAEVLPSGEIELYASGFPRPIPGVPPERNLKGISFAVANATGLLARVLAHDRGDEGAAGGHLAAALGRALVAGSGTTPSS
jgi:subtilisin family serine protease